MISSVLIRRFCALVLAALVMTALCIWLLFSAMSGHVFLKLRAADLLPRAQSFAHIADDFINDRSSEKQILDLVNTSEDDGSLLGAYAIIADRDGAILLASDSNGLPDEKETARQIGPVLSGKTVYTVMKTAAGEKMVVIGVPVTDRSGRLDGALILYMPQVDTMVAKGVLSGALAMSMCIVVPAVFMLMFALVYRLVQPLRHMRDVALRMAEGRFDYVADETAMGEVGQLGASLNRMSQALKKSISELTFERNRLLRILNGMGEGICAVDKRSVITHMNPALSGIFGKTFAESDPRLSAIPVPEVWEAFDRAVNEGNGSEFTVKIGEKDISCGISPVLDDTGNTAGAVGMFRDISNEVRLENTRREYVANVSHEMRTPLTAMRGLVEPLRDGLVTDEATRQRYYDIILRETLRLSRLINDIMELSRLQSGTTSIEKEDFRPGEIIEGTIERFSAPAAEKGITLSCACDPAALPAVRSNRDRIEQLLVILVDNAIKYTDAGSVSIGAEVLKDRLVLSVSDTGRGISPDNLGHVFDRFFKADKAHSGNGSGLGLSIAREVLSAMGEQIFVTSQEGSGSVFSFTVQRAAEKQ